MGRNEVNNFFCNLNNYIYTSKIIKKPIKRKVKSFGIYKTILFKGLVTTKFKKVNLSGFKKHYCINRTNRIVGYTPDYVGPTPSRIQNGDNILIKFFLDKFSDIKTDCSADFYKQFLESSSDTRITYRRGFTSVHSHLKEYFKDDITTFTPTEIIKELSINNFKWFKSPICSFYNSKEIDFFIRVNLKAFTGHYTSRILCQNKYFSTDISRAVAKRLHKILSIRPIKNWYLWSILGREKDIKLEINDTEKDVGSRAILTTEDAMSTLLMWYSQKLQNTFFYNNGSKFNLKGEFNSRKSYDLHKRIKKYDYILEADWEFFDSNVDGSYIIAACSILLDGLPDDKLHNNIRYLITSSILTKYVVVHPGVVVELNRAVPSGHPFTSLINCIVNTIYWSQIGRKIYGDDYAEMMDVELYGDDALVMFKHSENLDKIDQIIDSLNIKSEPLYENIVSIKQYYFDNTEFPDFLKRRIDFNKFKWNYKKMFDKLLYQSKKRSYDDQILLFLSYVETSPYDSNLHKVLVHLSEYINRVNIYYKINIDIRNRVEALLSDNDSLSKITDKYEPYTLSKSENTYTLTYQNIYKFSGEYLKFTNISPLVRRCTEMKYHRFISLGIPIELINKNKFIFDTYHEVKDELTDSSTSCDKYNYFVVDYNRRINKRILLNRFNKISDNNPLNVLRFNIYKYFEVLKIDFYLKIENIFEYINFYLFKYFNVG